VRASSRLSKIGNSRASSVELINPALAFYLVWSGWRLAASREASGVPQTVKVERRRQKRQLFEVADLEWAGCLLPWEEGEEVRSRILRDLVSDFFGSQILRAFLAKKPEVIGLCG
jgi:hypothetical protein